MNDGTDGAHAQSINNSAKAEWVLVIGKTFVAAFCCCLRSFRIPSFACFRRVLHVQSQIVVRRREHEYLRVHWGYLLTPVFLYN